MQIQTKQLQYIWLTHLTNYISTPNLKETTHKKQQKMLAKIATNSAENKN
jgi:hypothetical protein